jgi:hypothetical protein
VEINFFSAITVILKDCSYFRPENEATRITASGTLALQKKECFHEKNTHYTSYLILTGFFWLLSHTSLTDCASARAFGCSGDFRFRPPSARFSGMFESGRGGGGTATRRVPVGGAPPGSTDPVPGAAFAGTNRRLPELEVTAAP